MTTHVSTAAGGASLRVSVHTDDGLLTLAYTVRNEHPQPIYAFNRLHRGIDDSGTFATDPHLVNVEVVGAAVIISKKVVPVPPRMRVETQEIPALTRIPPGTEFEETLSLRVPFRPWTPYIAPGEDELAEPRAMPATFQLGFFHTAAGDESLIRTVKTLQGPAFFFSLAAPYQSILEVPLPHPVPVRTSGPGAPSGLS